MSDEVGNLPYLISQGFSPTILKRFWTHVQKTETCWLWIGARTYNGYGRICKRWDNSVKKSIITGAHQASWMIHVGAIKGLCVCHYCDVRNCVRPSHLFLATRSENQIDGVIKKRVNKLRKLTEEDVRDIRKICASGARKITGVAKEFGITVDYVYAIKNGINCSRFGLD